MISVLIPVYNSENYIAEAIESVLRQTYQDFEIIVVDDGSTDNTRQVIESFGEKVQYHYQKNYGAGVARNKCIALSRGDFLAFLDADDVWSKNKLELQMQEFEADNSLEAVFGMVENVKQKDWEQRVFQTNAPVENLFKGFTQTTMLIKRESFLRVGMFPEENTIGEFVDWLLRAKEANLQMKLLPELFLWRRIHDSNLGIKHRSKVNDYIKIIKKSIDRRRINQSK
ncbi:MAG: glycosyltransferase family 2 protein [Pyrinomonadaceae bacterium]|nr:glycosyltransferase family 2 protein [Pyrinomonadaceae bacterium]